MAGSASVQAFRCPSCGASVVIRALGRSLSVACGSCGSVMDPNDPNYKILDQTQAKMKYPPKIPLGTRGKFFDVLYEAVGFMVRCDKTGHYEWSEYLLYNPMMGFRWLVENNGHWNFATVVKGVTESPTGFTNYDGTAYKLFLTDSPRVIFVVGEFYWRVTVGEITTSEDYVAPPYMLTRETSEREVNWSRGVYLTVDDVKQGFEKTPLTLPRPQGVAPNQPNPNKDLGGMLSMAVLFGIGAICAAAIGPVGVGNNSFTALIAIVAFPILKSMRMSSFENTRWADSDFPPISNRGNSDDD